MNDKMDIPDGERLDIDEETDLDVTDLPGEWEWSTANHIRWNHKVNVYFELNAAETGGFLGEIDNWTRDGEEAWTVHIRPIVDVPDTDRNRPRGEVETAEEFETLDEAIQSVPDHIDDCYPVRFEEVDA